MRFSRWVVVSRLLICFSFASACGPGADGLSTPSGDDARQASRALNTTHLRLMAGNLSSGNGQSYTPGHGMRIFQGCHPDVALIQEFNYGTNSAADIRAFVDTTFGTGFSVVRGAPKQIPNGVVSRYPIVASGDWDDPTVTNREFTWAHIDLPGPNDLWAVSVHLLTSGAGSRQAESSSLVAFLKANVPANDYVVIGGDFNVSARTEAAVNTLSVVVTTAVPWPVDLNGNGNTNASRKAPYDWVLVSSGLQALTVPTVIGTRSFANGFVADTRVYSPITDLSPALASDSAAPSMQHMGVVRDFELPVVIQPPEASVTVTAPNGGESFTIGTSQTIAWSSTNVSAVNVAYSSDGVSFVTVASNVPASQGSVSWQVPTPASTAAVVKVSDASNAAVADGSDAPFTVKVPQSLHLDSPNGGESFAALSTQTITWSAVGVSTLEVAYAADGVSFTPVASGVPASPGSLTWVVPAPPTTAARVRISDSATGLLGDVSDAAFSVTVVSSPAQVIINEVLANEPGSDPAGEFVELVNVGGSAADLSGFTLSDSSSVRHTFAAGTGLAAGATVVVFGKLTAAPAGITAVGASTGSLALTNGGDTVKLADKTGVSIDAVTYPASLAAVDGVSMNRSPDRTAGAAWVLHTKLSTAQSSPGTTP